MSHKQKEKTQQQQQQHSLDLWTIEAYNKIGLCICYDVFFFFFNNKGVGITTFQWELALTRFQIQCDPT